MAPASNSKTAEEQGIKRKRASAHIANIEDAAGVSTDDAATSSASEQSEEPLLDSFANNIAEPLEAFNDALASTTAFLRPSEQLSSLARSAAKALYDYTRMDAMAQPAAEPRAGADGTTGALTELHVEGFDAEQIWLQLDMASAQLVRRARRLLKKAGTDPALLTPEREQDLTELLSGVSLDIEDEADDSDVDNASDLADLLAAGTPTNDVSEDELDSDMDKQNGPLTTNRAAKALLPTEDRFLKLDDLESFLEDAERSAAANDDEEGDQDDPEDKLGEDLDGDESEEEEMDLLDAENDSDADLDALLEDSNRLIGRSANQGRKRARTGLARQLAKDIQAEDEDEEEEDDAGYMYADLWGDKGSKKIPSDRLQDDLDEEEEHFTVNDQDLPASEAESDADMDASDDPDQSQDEPDPDDDGMGIFRQAIDQSAVPAIGSADAATALLDDDATAAAAGKDSTAGLSKHQQQQLRMQERIAKLEAQNMAEKDWFMQGEAGAARRPLNSALELDLDFERQIRPPPQPTEEATASLEDLIKERIANQQFDDPPRLLPPEPEKAKVALEMDDKKSQKGLGEVYEEEYVAATASGASTAVDKQDAVRQEAKNLLKELFGKLDALSHFQYAPKPIIEEMQVRSDVPALAMEEVAPQVASEAAMRAPEEVYRAQQQGAPKSTEEVSREDRTRLRAKKKRAGKKRQLQLEQTNKEPQSNVTGQKSETALMVASKKSKKGRATSQAPDKDAKISYSKSGSVFKRMQEQADAAAAGNPPSASDAFKEPLRKKAAALKL